MKTQAGIVSKKDILRYRNNADKIDYLDINTINDIIKEITTGPLGKCTPTSSNKFINDAKINRVFTYEDDYISLAYHKEKTSSGYDSYTDFCTVSFCGKEVYPDMRLRENNWINLLLHLYSKHLTVVQESISKQEAKRKAEEKKQIVMRVFGFSYPNGYADENVTVSDIKVGKTFTAFPDNEIYYNYIGKITLSDGTVVCDSDNDIYIPGPWEDYICSVVRKMQEEAVAEQKKQYAEIMLKRERLKNNNNN